MENKRLSELLALMAQKQQEEQGQLNPEAIALEEGEENLPMNDPETNLPMSQERFMQLRQMFKQR